MPRVTQRQASLAIMGILLVADLVAGIVSALGYAELPLAVIGVAAVLLGGLMYAYWRGWDQARYAVLLVIFIVQAFFSRPNNVWFDALIPCAIAAVMADVWWIVGTGVLGYVIMLARADFTGAYADPLILVRIVLLLTAFVLSRMIADAAIRTARSAANEADVRREEVEAYANNLQHQSQELEKNYREQQALLTLVAELEVPTVTLANGVIMAPLIGKMTSERLDRTAERLLATVHAQRIRLVVIDVAGVPSLTTQGVQALINLVYALELLGCRVCITSISSAVALEITQADIDWSVLNVAPTPQAALAQFRETMAV